MTTKRIMLFFGIFVIAAFSLFVSFYQNHVRAKALFQINDHANVIASSLWTFEESSPTAYLTLAAKANGYERIVVKDDKGRIFLDISGPQPTKLDEVLLSTNLIPVYQLESIVEFEGRSIGKISAAWPCRTIYTYMYILFCVFLLLTGIWLFLRLLDSNRTLESRVRQRTAELEKENNERKRTEEAFRLSEERLRLALDGTFDGIWDWNLQTGQVYFSPRYYTMMGYEPGEFAASYESWRQLLHPDDLEPSEGVVQKAIENHSPFAIEFRFKAKSGEWRWILGRGKVAESDLAGKAVRVAGSHTDITERKRAEEALRKYERIVSTSQDLMALVNRDYVYEAVNESYLRHTSGRESTWWAGRCPKSWGGRVSGDDPVTPRSGFFGSHSPLSSAVRLRGSRSEDHGRHLLPMFEETGKVEGVVVNSGISPRPAGWKNN